MSEKYSWGNSEPGNSGYDWGVSGSQSSWYAAQPQNSWGASDSQNRGQQPGGAYGAGGPNGRGGPGGGPGAAATGGSTLKIVAVSAAIIAVASGIAWAAFSAAGSDDADGSNNVAAATTTSSSDAAESSATEPSASKSSTEPSTTSESTAESAATTQSSNSSSAATSPEPIVTTNTNSGISEAEKCGPYADKLSDFPHKLLRLHCDGEWLYLAEKGTSNKGLFYWDDGGWQIFNMDGSIGPGNVSCYDPARLQEAGVPRSVQSELAEC